MNKSTKVTIELTPEQRNRIKTETGKEVKSLTFDALEDRIAPSMAKLPTDPRVVGGK